MTITARAGEPKTARPGVAGEAETATAVAPPAPRPARRPLALLDESWVLEP